MPTYSYLCTECAHEFEIHQSFTDDSLTVCPACAGVLRKVFSPVGVSFSGPGFYRTDSRDQPSGKLPARSGDSDKSGGSDKTGGAEKSGGKDASPSTSGSQATGTSTGHSSGSGGSGSSTGKSSGTSAGATKKSN